MPYMSYLNLLDNFNFGFTLSATYLLSFIGILVIAFLISLIGHRIRFGRRRKTIKISKRIGSALDSFGGKRLSAIGIFVLFAHLFLWLTQLFLTNNIKANKVVRPDSK